MESPLTRRPEAFESALRLCRDRLSAFAKFATYKRRPAKHQEDLCDVLQRVIDGDITRLIISFPPGHGKTVNAGVYAPVWALARNPDERIIYVSFSADRAEEVSAIARGLVQDDRFLAVFPEHSPDKGRAALSNWSLTGARGFYKAVGRGGPITGSRADLMIIDDPYKDREEADSETIRQKLWDWYTSVCLTRLIPTSRLIVIHTRWHQDDLIGRLLAEQENGTGDNWEVFNFPALGGDDESVPLWPEMYGKEYYDQIRQAVGPRDWSALFQGTPVPDGGGLFKRDYFSVQNYVPRLGLWIRYWDLAASTKSHGDYTVGARVGVDSDGTVWVADVKRFRAEWPEVRRRILETVIEDGPNTWVGVEKSGFQLAAVQDLRRNDEFLTVPLYEITPDKDKYSRAAPWAARGAEGKLALVQGAWVQGFIDECLVFPYGKHDDQVDAVSGAVKLLVEVRGGVPKHDNPPPAGSLEYYRRLGAQYRGEDSW